MKKDINNIIELAKKFGCSVSKIGDDYIHVIGTFNQYYLMSKEAEKQKIMTRTISGFDSESLILMYYSKFA
jgi:hypothetical protein